MKPVHREFTNRLGADSDITNDPFHTKPETRQKMYQIAEELGIEVQIAGFGGEHFALNKTK